MIGSQFKLNCFRVLSLWVVGAVLGLPHLAFATPLGLELAPFAEVSSTKSIKPSKNANKSDEVVSQRITYGLGIHLRLSHMFFLGMRGGVNNLDTSKSQTAMRDEFGEIDFVKDASINTSDATASYRYRESQRLAEARLIFKPLQYRAFWAQVSGGVRARQRLVKINDETAVNVVTEIKDPIRYHAVGGAGFGVRLFQNLSYRMEYSFYFMKFPKIEPHEQSVLVGFDFRL